MKQGGDNMGNAKAKKWQEDKKAAQKRHGGPKNNDPKPSKKQNTRVHGTNRK